jgi:hypothetical protein
MGASVVRTLLPDGVARCHALPSMYVIERPSGLTEYSPEPNPAPKVASIVVVPPARSAFTIWLLAVV